MTNENDERPPNAGVLRRSLVSLGVFLLVLVLLLFLPAGKIGWWQGWLFVAIFVFQVTVASLSLWRKYPEIFVARSKIQKGTKAWDKVLLLPVILSFVAIFAVAGLDERFHWSFAPVWVIVLGYILLTAGMVGSIWVYGVNEFAEPGVRIQTERGHRSWTPALTPSSGILCIWLRSSWWPVSHWPWAHIGR
jgi:hypothetical protein